MSQSVPTVPGEGVILTLPLKKKYKENPSKKWCFTVFDYNEDTITALCAKCADVPGTKYIFGREICPETKKTHLQCFVYFNKKVRWSTIFKDIIPLSTHREVAKGNLNENLRYCSKENNYVSNCKILPLYKKPHRELRPWQAFVERRIIENTNNDRKVLWIYDNIGNIGKSVLVNYLVVNYGAIAVSGAKRHVLSVAHKNPKCPLWIFDIPRTNKNGVSYDAIEGLRNGLWMSGFDDCTGMTCLEFNPMVVVFANELPEWDKLSRDRWDVWEIDEVLNPVYRPVGYKGAPIDFNYDYSTEED